MYDKLPYQATTKCFFHFVGKSVLLHVIRGTFNSPRNHSLTGRGRPLGGEKGEVSISFVDTALTSPTALEPDRSRAEPPGDRMRHWRVDGSINERSREQRAEINAKYLVADTGFPIRRASAPVHHHRSFLRRLRSRRGGSQRSTQSRLIPKTRGKRLERRRRAHSKSLQTQRSEGRIESCKA